MNMNYDNYATATDKESGLPAHCTLNGILTDPFNCCVCLFIYLIIIVYI